MAIAPLSTFIPGIMPLFARYSGIAIPSIACLIVSSNKMMPERNSSAPGVVKSIFL